MKEYKYILREKTDDGIVTITLNRPEVFNAFNRKMAEELLDALDNFEDAEDEWFCILTGAGKAFCAGEDLKNINLDASPKEQEDATRKALKSYHQIIYAILESSKPIVAALNGTAAGAGLSIALACDERFAVGPGEARLIPGFATLGLTPDAGMIALLERFMTKRQVSEWCEKGFSISPRDAKEMGVIDGFFERNDVEPKLEVPRIYARNLKETRSLKEYGATKALLNAEILDLLDNRIFGLELEYQVRLEQGEDFQEGLTAFREKRKPRFNKDLRGGKDDRPEA